MTSIWRPLDQWRPEALERIAALYGIEKKFRGRDVGDADYIAARWRFTPP
jgi:hypothetical protein